MGPLRQAFFSFAATLSAYAIYRIMKAVYEHLSSPLRFLPGPPNTSLLYGNMKEIWAAVSVSYLQSVCGP